MHPFTVVSELNGRLEKMGELTNKLQTDKQQQPSTAALYKRCKSNRKRRTVTDSHDTRAGNDLH